ncbi:MAG TPA: hypothetical protein VGR55_14070 [Candidatus Acidoferrum sp.]|nr:hypothetical protein [Candidatus Acidoferrum sp.]
MSNRALARLVLTCLVLLFFGVRSGLAGGKTVIRGWLSDEGCAGGRAHDGVYTGTNPDCAKRCVHDGKKIVLVDPEGKRLLFIANQDAARERVGDYVEISGEVDDQAKTLRVDSMKLLEKGRAMCDVPAKKKS